MAIIAVVTMFGYMYYIAMSESDNISHSYLSSEIMKKESNDVFSTDIKALMDRENVWGFVLDESGAINQSYKLPSELNKEYKISDVVGFTRYYLNDYPVFTYILKDGVLVLGYPTGSYDKLAFNYFNASIVFSTLKFIGIFLLINLAVIVVFYLYSKKRLYTDIIPIQEGVTKLAGGEEVIINTEGTGELSEIFVSINDASKRIKELRMQREKWIRGISHDIRTPLAKIAWSVDAIENDCDTEKNLKKISQNLNIVSNLVDDLNLTTALESKNFYDSFKKENPVSVLRSQLAKFTDSNPDYSIEFNNELVEQIQINMDSKLFSRAINNLLNNSVVHNSPCNIMVSISENDSIIHIVLEDSGNITDETISELNHSYNPVDYSPRGLGIVIVKQIISMHDGEIEFSRSSLGGLKSEIKIRNL